MCTYMCTCTVYMYMYVNQLLHVHCTFQPFTIKFYNSCLSVTNYVSSTPHSSSAYHIYPKMLVGVIFGISTVDFQHWIIHVKTFVGVLK